MPGQGGPGDGAGNAGGGSCLEQPLFPFRGFGEDSTDLVRFIHLDEPTGDIYFSVYLELYLLRAGSSAPQKIADEGDAFWLASDKILFPAFAQVGQSIEVLRGMSRSGGQATALVTTPGPALTSTSERFSVEEVEVEGDDVLWIERQRAGAFTASETSTFLVRKTSWRAPSTPQLLYTSPRRLENLLVAGGKVYVSEQTAAQDGSVQKSVDLASGTVDAMTSQDRYRGEVVGGDEASLIVSREPDVQNPTDYGTFRVAPDGSGETQISKSFVIFRSVFYMAHRQGTWVWSEREDLASSEIVHAYTVAGGKRQIGCVNNTRPTNAFAIEIGDGAVFLSVLRESKSATILRYPL